MPRHLDDGADVVIYFADSLAGTDVTCDVKALSSDRVVAATTITPHLVARTVIDAMAELKPLLGAKVDGAPCDRADECESNICADGVCCQTQCTGTCRSCAVPGKQGSCTLVPEGVKHPDCLDQPAATCGFDGTCDGLGACRRHPLGTTCAPGTCTGNSVTAGGACDGNGSCVTSPALSPLRLRSLGPQAPLLRHLHQPRPVRAGPRLREQQLRQEAARGHVHRERRMRQRLLRRRGLLRDEVRGPLRQLRAGRLAGRVPARAERGDGSAQAVRR
jgi:hypothetical protein